MEEGYDHDHAMVKGRFEKPDNDSGGKKITITFKRPASEKLEEKESKLSRKSPIQSERPRDLVTTVKDDAVKESNKKTPNVRKPKNKVTFVIGPDEDRSDSSETSPVSDRTPPSPVHDSKSTVSTRRSRPRDSRSRSPEPRTKSPERERRSCDSSTRSSKQRSRSSEEPSQSSKLQLAHGINFMLNPDNFFELTENERKLVTHAQSVTDYANTVTDHIYQLRQAIESNCVAQKLCTTEFAANAVLHAQRLGALKKWTERVVGNSQDLSPRPPGINTEHMVAYPKIVSTTGNQRKDNESVLNSLRAIPTNFKVETRIVNLTTSDDWDALRRENERLEADARTYNEFDQGRVRKR